MSDPLRVALFYDMDACYGPTGVTRHALSQLERLRARPEIAFRLITGRITHPDGLAYWESLERLARRELPLRTRDILRWWRLKPWPPIEWWSGRSTGSIVRPSFSFRPARAAGRSPAMTCCRTSVRTSPKTRVAWPRLRAGRFDPVCLAIQHRSPAGGFSGLPGPRRVRAQWRGRPVLRAGNRATSENAVRADLGLPPQIPYLLSVANFQPRKNLVRFIHAAVRLPEVSAGTWRWY